MDNIILELKIKEIINETNFFDMIIKAQEFEVEYKKSDFYKMTKMPVLQVIEKAKVFYAFQFENIGEKIQNFINSLDVTKLQEIIEQLGQIYMTENQEIMEIVSEFGKIVK